MRNISIFALSAALVACVSSCELKDELRGEDGAASDMGALELAVDVQGASRADANVPSAGDMYVEVVGTEDAAEPVYSGFYRDMENPVRIPIGTYSVKAHTEGEIKKQMPSPYYGGSQELVISKDITSQAEVVCKIMNTKVTMGYGDNFKGKFSSWTITLDNGKESVLTFTEKGEAPVYWYLAEDEVSSLTLNFTGVTSDAEAETISWQKSFSKADADEVYEDDDKFFTGGEALDITFDIEESGEPEPGNRPQISFDITVDLTFGDTNETVEIPVEDVTEPGGGEEPEPTDEIVISDNGTGYLENGVTVSGGAYPTDVAVVMDVKNGIKSVYVKIATTNSTFESMVRDMGLVDGDGMDLASESAASLASLFPLPQAGATGYTFTMSDTLFGLLANFAGKHDFTLTVIDANGNQQSATLTINI